MHKDLTNGEVACHIRTLALPATIGFFFHTMYNVTDTYFAGIVSTEALAALSVTFSIFFIVIAVANGMAESITSLVGNAMGEGLDDEADFIALNALYFGVFLAIGLTGAAYASAPSLLKVLGAGGSYLATSLEYINIIIAGSLFFVYTFFVNAMLNAVGDMVSFRNVLVAGFVLNIGFDYWFVMGGFGIEPMGVNGIAVATVVIEALSMVYLFYRLKKTPLLDGLKRFSLDLRIFREIIVLGVPPSLNLVLVGLGIFLITYFVAPFGEEVVAAYGVGMRIEQIALMPAIGINMAVLAIVSQNSGAKAYARIEQTLSIALFYGALISVVGMFGLFIGAEMLMELFSEDEQVVKEGVRYLRIDALVMYAYVIIFIGLALLQGIKRPLFGFYVSLLRQVLFPIALFTVLAYLQTGVVAYWWGIAGITWLSAVIVWRYAKVELKKLNGAEAEGAG
jgi:putative MATE family efflux protein